MGDEQGGGGGVPFKQPNTMGYKAIAEVINIIISDTITRSWQMEQTILDDFLDKDYLMEEYKESKVLSSKPSSTKGYMRGKAKKWFEYEHSMMQRKHQEYFVFLGLALKKGHKHYTEVVRIKTGRKRKCRNRETIKQNSCREKEEEIMQENIGESSDLMEVEPSRGSEGSSAKDRPESMDTSEDQINLSTNNLAAKSSKLADHPVMRAQYLTDNSPKLKLRTRVKAPKKYQNYCGDILQYLVRGPARANPGRK